MVTGMLSDMQVANPPAVVEKVTSEKPSVLAKRLFSCCTDAVTSRPIPKRTYKREGLKTFGELMSVEEVQDEIFGWKSFGKVDGSWKYSRLY